MFQLNRSVWQSLEKKKDFSIFNLLLLVYVPLSTLSLFLRMRALLEKALSVIFHRLTFEWINMRGLCLKITNKVTVPSCFDVCLSRFHIRTLVPVVFWHWRPRVSWWVWTSINWSSLMLTLVFLSEAIIQYITSCRVNLSLLFCLL